MMRRVFNWPIFSLNQVTPDEQAEAHKVLWELAGKEGAYKRPAIEALARAPELSSEERERVLRALEQLSPKDLTDDLLAADMRMQIQPDDAARIYDETIDHWRDSKVEQLVELARWLNAHQQAERVLTLFPIERALQNNTLLLTRLMRWPFCSVGPTSTTR